MTKRRPDTVKLDLIRYRFERERAISEAIRACDRLIDLASATKRCLEGPAGGFPIYLTDLTAAASNLVHLACVYGVLRQIEDPPWGTPRTAR